MPIHEWGYKVTDRQPNEEENTLSKEPIEDITTWVFEAGTFVPTAKILDGKQYSIVSDYLGTPIQMYDEQGDKTWDCTLDIYGKVIAMDKGAEFDCPFRFQGQFADEETELYYNRFRFYIPSTGSFISQDPIRLAGNNPTLYGYVFDTNTWTDLFGLRKVKSTKTINGTQIYGKGQITGLGHDKATEKLAEDLANTGKYKEIYMDLSWNTANHTSSGVYQNISRKRPDLILVDNNNKLYSIEIASKSDNIGDLKQRNNISVSHGYGYLDKGDYDANGNIINDTNIKHLH